jgi:hypothetical protein
MLTASENRAFDAWLCRVSARCERLSGIDLNDCQSRIESAGVLPEPGLRHLLCQRWRRGAAVGPSAGWLLEIVRRQCEAVADDEAGPLEAAADLMIAAADRCDRRAATLPANERQVRESFRELNWQRFLVAVDSGFRAALDDLQTAA